MQNARWAVQVECDEVGRSALKGLSPNNAFAFIDGPEGELDLVALALEAHDSPTEVRTEALSILGLLSGGIALATGSRHEFSAGSVRERDGSAWLFPKPIEGRGTFTASAIGVVAADGTETAHRQTDPVVRWATISSPAVAKALRLWSRPELSWVELNRILEVVSTEVPYAEMVARAWVSRKRLDLFTHTANSVSAVGDAARHGRENTRPPAKPMPLPLARNLVEQVLRKWLGY